MQTALDNTSSNLISILCTRFIESCWLATIVLTPLFFNLYSNRIFEADKVALVRSLALLMLGAWAIKRVRVWLSCISLKRAVREAIDANPLAVPACIMVIVCLLASFFSISPMISFWGSYQRLEGAYTTLSYVAIFLITAATLRTRAQMDRLIDTAIIISFPVASYGIIQHLGLDPLIWDNDVSVRVSSSVGSPVFLAAYLAMMVPLTLARLIETWTRVLRSSVHRYMLILAYFVVLFAQLLAILFTQTRGAWIGLASSVTLFLLILAVLRGARKVVFAIIGSTVVLAVSLAVFNFPDSPLNALKRVPYLGRFGGLFEGEAATGTTREMIWRGALELALPHEPLWSPATGDDPFNTIRPIIGYGPDTMLEAYLRFYPSGLGPYEGRLNSPDRSHNVLFDALAMTGLLGLGATLWLFTALAYWGLVWLGLIRSATQQKVFLSSWFGTGITMALIMGAWQGWQWVGPALPTGMMLGLIIFLTLALRQRGANTVDPHHSLWLGALFAVLIGHFIELQVGIPVVTTELCFWLFAALLVALGTDQLAEDPLPERRLATPDLRNKRHYRDRPKDKPLGWEPGEMALSGIVAMILFTLGFDFLGNRSGDASPLDAILRSLNLSVLLLAGGTCLIAILVFSDGWSKHSRSIIWLVGSSLLVVFGLLVLLGTMLTQRGDVANTMTNLIAFYYLAVFALIIGTSLALTLQVPQRLNLAPMREVGFGLPCALAIVCGMAIYFTNYDAVAADALVKFGNSLVGVGSWDRASSMFQRAHELEPNQYYYELAWGHAHQEKARAAADPMQGEQVFRLSEQAFLRAVELNPFSMEPAMNLGYLHRAWAMRAGDPTKRNAHLAQSSQYFEVAVRLSPNMPYLRNEWSETLVGMGDWNGARSQLDQSLRLDPSYPQTYYYDGEYYRGRQDWDLALSSYLKVIALDPSVLADANGSPLPGPLSVLKRPEFLPRAVEAYQAADIRFPRAIEVKSALDTLRRNSVQ